MRYIYDTAEITSRRLTDLKEDFVVPSRVMEEIRKGFLARELETMRESITVMDPDRESRNAAVKAARETGDIGGLSETDIDVIALAFMINGTVRTDDYAIQNTCAHMGIPAESSTTQGIRKEIRWIWRCTGCRRKYNTFRESCSFCGHTLKKFPASQKKIR